MRGDGDGPGRGGDVIRVTVELCPGGKEQNKRLLGTAEITNDESGTKGRGNYICRLFKWGIRRRLWRESRITNFPRETFGPWDLLFIALFGALGEDRLRRMPKDCKTKGIE